MVSGLLSDRGAAYQLLEAWRVGAFVLLYSDAIYAEYADVLPRPKFARYHLTPEIIAAFLRRVRRHGRRVTPRRRLPITVRDPKDDMVLAAALGGHADYLVTGDADLLDLRGRPELGTLQIVPVAEFLAILKQP
ncbi:MAG: putative toxin-antitoxin system toxin component, PIN family [Dehalococcoidia bacterium]